MTYDVIIVGSGATGVAAALSFAENGIKPAVLDVGYQLQNDISINQNFYDYRKFNDSFDVMIGDNYEGISNVINGRSYPPKLTSPNMRFVTKGADKLSPVNEDGFTVIQSFAMGGLANAWGAGLYRCIDDELINLPFNASELLPYYDKLTNEIGISGDIDDLAPFFGSTDNLLPPFKLSAKSEKMFLNYCKKKIKINKSGIFIGRPRLGVLSGNYQQRNMYEYHNLDLWMSNISAIYTPAFTVKRLVRENKITYHKSLIVRNWTRSDDCLTVHAEDVNDRTITSFKCRKLVLAAGTINSSKIVLSSKRDLRTKLSLIDNPLLKIPLIFPGFVGSKLEKNAFGLTNLNVVCDFRKYNLRLQGSIIELTSPARAAFYEMFPFSAKDNLSLLRVFSTAILVLFLYFPASNKNSGYVRLLPDGTLEACSHRHKVNMNLVRKVIKTLMSLGAFTCSSLIKYAPSGSAIHYAGTLPMMLNPKQEYQCNNYGELWNEPNVFVVDGSLFSYLPSKNISFTLMANAMRIADHISKKIK